jgi:uncharacterized protein (TIGR02284 family)
MNNKELLDDLNLLFSRNYDAIKGYKMATEKCQSEELRIFFHKKTRIRKEFGRYLEAEIKKLGGQALKHTSLSTAFHDHWMDLKAFLGAHDEKAVISEALRGEERALEDYEEVLQHQAVCEQSSLKAFIQEQQNALLETIAELKRFAREYALS